MDSSPLGLFLFSLFFYFHLSSVCTDIELMSVGIETREILLKKTNKCVLKYLDNREPSKSITLLRFALERCALSNYFQLDEYGRRGKLGRPSGSTIINLFPLFQHPHLKNCNSFLFFGTSSHEMSAELEILASVDFKMLECKYLVVDKRKNVHGLRNYIHVPQLSETHLTDILWQYKADKDYIIEHLYISELEEIENFVDNLLKIRQLFAVQPCQVTVRLPRTFSAERLWQFAEDVLKNEDYVLLSVMAMEKFTE
uniref:Uncharacterized protein n=1 Tax=Caenorhabditis japonica TaxID=281687 RepID=A0A8R1DPF8_CAEJA